MRWAPVIRAAGRLSPIEVTRRRSDGDSRPLCRFVSCRPWAGPRAALTGLVGSPLLALLSLRASSSPLQPQACPARSRTRSFTCSTRSQRSTSTRIKPPARLVSAFPQLAPYVLARPQPARSRCFRCSTTSFNQQPIQILHDKTDQVRPACSLLTAVAAADLARSLLGPRELTSALPRHVLQNDPRRIAFLEQQPRFEQQPA